MGFAPERNNKMAPMIRPNRTATSGTLTPRHRRRATLTRRSPGFSVAVTVVMAAQGYPDEYPTGHEIGGVEAAEATGCIVYIAGAKRQGARLLTNGGRVLAVTALGRSVEDAARNAYKGIARIHFNEAQYRRDIGRAMPPIAPPRSKKRPASLPKQRRKN